MRNLFALLFVAAAFTFTACEQKQEGTANADSANAVKDSVPATDPVAQPTDTAKTDSVKVDSVKK